MSTINAHHLETLKALVLIKAGVRSITPADCRVLSILIYKETGQSVSETTIKRLYGFALAKFSPSYFTLNAFAVYCGYSGWDSFRDTQISNPAIGQTSDPNRLTYYITRPQEADSPLTHVLLNTDVPTAILKANAPDFTILSYNQAYQKAAYIKNRPIKGQSIWEAFPPDKAGGAGPTLLLEAFYEAVFKKQIVKMEPLHYDIQSEFSNAGQLSWWDVEIIPVVVDEVVRSLVVKSINITDKVLHQDAIEQAIMSELTMAEDLAKTNVALNTALAGLAESHKELMATKTQLEELNQNLEQAVFERTRNFFNSEARQRKLIDNAPVAIAILKGDNHIIETANKKIIDYWGKTTAVIAKPLAVALPELEGQPFIDILDQVHSSGVPYINSELCAYLDIEGVYQPRYYDMIYQPMQNEPGVTDCIFIVAVDITYQVAARKKLEESESLLRLAVNAARIGTWSFDPTDKKMQYNKIFAELLGWDKPTLMTFEEAINQVTDEFKTKIIAAIDKAINDGGEYDITYAQKRFNDGKTVRLRSMGKITVEGPEKKVCFSGILMQTGPAVNI